MAAIFCLDKIWQPYLVLMDQIWLQYLVPSCHILSPNIIPLFFVQTYLFFIHGTLLSSKQLYYFAQIEYDSYS